MGWASAVIGGFKVWTTLKPFKRWKARRQRKRDRERITEELTSEYIAIVGHEEPKMGEQGKSLLRSVLKILGTVLVTKGAIDAGQADAAIAAIEAVVGGAVALVGLWLSKKKHEVTAE